MKKNVVLLAVSGFLLVGLVMVPHATSQQVFTKAWEVELKYPNYEGIANDLFADDINGDRKPEVLLASIFNGTINPSLQTPIRGRLVTLDATGKEVWWYETNEGQIFPFISVAVSDVDDDGVNDVALAGYNLEVINPRSSLWGDPDGTTRLTNALKNSFMTNKQPQALTIGDIDADGKKEILFGVKGVEGATANQWFVYCLYKGGRADKWKHEVAGPPGKIIISDVDGNGQKEIAALTTKNLYLLDSEGDELWSVYTNITNKDMALYDLEGDGKVEIIVANEKGEMLIYDKNGKLTKRKYKTIEEPIDLAVEDVNNDGSPEIFYTSTDSTLIVIDVEGNELFRQTDFRGSFVHSLFLHDMNRDGKKDMLVISDDWEDSKGKCDTGKIKPLSGGAPFHSTVYLFYNTFPSQVVEQAQSEQMYMDYFDLAEGYFDSGQYEKAREYYIKARDGFSAAGNKDMAARCNARLEEIASLSGAPTEKPKESGIGALALIAALVIASRKR